jgi:predicted dehydrogenase
MVRGRRGKVRASGMVSPVSPLRIGILGAARIAPLALIRPARANEGVEVVAIAARDPKKAAAFARKHGIPRTCASYDELIADPGIDAIYNPLPNGLHGRWTLAALKARKHVLCEKPFTANEEEAQVVARAAEDSGLVVMEAFHWRYHPMAARLEELCGQLGPIKHVDIKFSAPLAKPGDIRYRLDLAGGAMMDMGCYTVSLLRLLCGGEPVVTSARAKQSSDRVDRAMRATLTLPGGGTARVACSMFSSSLLALHASVEAENGSLRAFNPFAPQYFNRITIKDKAGRRVEKLTRVPTYNFQLEAFRAAVLDKGPVITDPHYATQNMAVIDAVYRASGLGIRQPTV